MRKTAFLKLWALILVIGILIPSSGVFSQSSNTITEHQVFLPFVFNPEPAIGITDSWVGNAAGYERSVFRPADEIEFITVGENSGSSTFDASLKWTQVGPSGITDIFSGTINMTPDIWVHVFESKAPELLGTYTNTVELTFKDSTFTQTNIFEVVNYTSEIVVSDQQGFDKCGLPTVDQMQTWWDHSPYNVFNIYLGGSSFACDNPELDTEWVWQVSQQGWEFILTWVGPQSPCFDTIKPKISTNTELAYQQGIEQADLALAAAEGLGITGDRIIYYDIEGYTESQTCRNAVDSFLTGWTQRLHDLGFKAGAYGSPCRSFMSDWWDNQPLLDDIWIARWLLPAEYREDVTVWGPVCGLTDDMWDGTRRLRQYAGDHHEEWGEISLGSIDSNVLLGEITAITTTTQIATTGSGLAGAPLSVPLLREAQMLTKNMGWVLQGNQLLSTQDAGETWWEITPAEVESILNVAFVDAQNGWLVSSDLGGDLILSQTQDGGQTWEDSKLPFSSPDLGAVYLERFDAQTGWIVLKYASGSSFSLGQLFATEDGGLTWEERSIPLGEPVEFRNSQDGWVTGGPTDDVFYQTQDGGRSWSIISENEFLLQQESEKNNLPEYTVQISATDSENVWALTKTGSCSGEKNPITEDAEPLWCWQQTQLWSTSNGGQTWVEITP